MECAHFTQFHHITYKKWSMDLPHLEQWTFNIAFREIQDGDWDKAADLLSSVSQGLCWEAGDTLNWGKAPGRAETSALWTLSWWKASPCHNLLKEQPVLHSKPLPIGQLSPCYAGCGISDPWAHSSASPGPCSHKLPPFRPAWSPVDWAPKLCQTSDPHMHDLCQAAPSGLHRPAQACTILLGCAPHTCTGLHPGP
jgi:hypothetical protein